MRAPILDASQIPVYLELKKQNITDEDIAKDYFFCSYITLYNWKKRNNLQVPHTKRERKLNTSHIPLYWKWRKIGLTDKDIAYKFGVSVGLLIKWKAENNIYVIGKRTNKH